MKSALVLVPPNISSMDSAAGGRFQATYNADEGEASHWIPLWVCYAAGAVPAGRAMDCNVEGLDREDFLSRAPDADVYVFFANQETITYDIETARLLAARRPASSIFFAGPYSTVAAEDIVGHEGIAGVIRGEPEQPLRDLCAGRPLDTIEGLTWKNGDQVVSNPDAPMLEDLDSLPWVSRIIRRDLPLLRYRIPYLNYPYMSLFSGRGCPHHCTYCLWPQVLSGHRYRKRGIDDVADEMLWIASALPEIREIQIEDDTFTCDRDRVLALCDALEGRGITWSCCARHDLPGDVLQRLKDAGTRNLVVGFESGNDTILKNIKKGINTRQARAFMQECRRIGLKVHGCFVFGLPGETPETMRETLEYAMDLMPDTVQFAIASPYEGTEFNGFLREKGFLREREGVTASGHLTARYDYPNLSGDEINRFTQQAWKKYYLRPSVILRQIRAALTDREEAKRLFHGARYLADYFLMEQPHSSRG